MVTTSITMNFMRRPPLAPLIAECRILKLGKRLAVVEVGIGPEAGGDLVAHATGDLFDHRLRGSIIPMA